MQTSRWFESWFDSPLYDQLYSYRDDKEAARLVSWIRHRFPPEKHPEVLDMGCGRGRHSLLLADEGYRVTGVDLSPLAISKALEKAQNGSLRKTKKTSSAAFEIGDMRTWRGGPFDLVCNLFTSFGYFDDDGDNALVLNNMVASIKNDGYLVMDYLNADYTKKHLVPHELLEVGSMQCEITRVIEKDTVIKTIHFRHQSSREHQNYQERVKLYDRSWFRDKFREAGLEDPQAAGDYDGSEYDPAGSSRLILYAGNKGS